MGSRLRLLVHAEVPGGAARDVAAGGVGAGDQADPVARTPVPFSFDLLLLERYWIERPAAYHHTAPVLGIYALHEALRLALEEGLEARWARHSQAAAHLRAELEALGLEVLAGPDCRLAPLTAVRVPEGADGKAVPGRLLRGDRIEVGGGLGPDAPAMWRVGPT